MLEIIGLLGDRFKASLVTAPSFTDWGVCLLVMMVYTAIAIPVGFWSGLLQYERVRSTSTILAHTGIALVFPAFVEEIIFRVLLIPHPLEGVGGKTLVGWSLLSLALFILSHPLNGWLVLTSRRTTFFNPWFLALAGLLGVVCTVTYVMSGSLYLPVIVHWIVVVIWLIYLGGDRRMSGSKA